MGKKDIALDAYFSSEEIFADLFNAWLYQGKQVIRPNLLQKQSPVQAVPEYAAQYKHIRDMVHMLYEGEVELLLLALENQTEIDYSEPLRVMEFDAADYRRQVRRIEEENRKRLGIKTGLPAFAKEDRITPVITLVLYFGEEEWEKPRSLHDMLKFTEKSEILKPFIPDYPIHVLSVQKDIDISLLHTELKQVIGFLQHQKEGDGLKRYVEENREVFSHLSGAGALFLSSAAKGTKLLKRLNQKEEPCNMFKALDDIYESGVAEGRKLGQKEAEARGERRGERRGEKRGEKRGEERFAALSERLLRDARLEDLKRAIGDREYRGRLYREYRLK